MLTAVHHQLVSAMDLDPASQAVILEDSTCTACFSARGSARWLHVLWGPKQPPALRHSADVFGRGNMLLSCSCCSVGPQGDCGHKEGHGISDSVFDTCTDMLPYVAVQTLTLRFYECYHFFTGFGIISLDLPRVVSFVLRPSPFNSPRVSPSILSSTTWGWTQ